MHPQCRKRIPAVRVLDRRGRRDGGAARDPALAPVRVCHRAARSVRSRADPNPQLAPHQAAVSTSAPRPRSACRCSPPEPRSPRWRGRCTTRPGSSPAAAYTRTGPLAHRVPAEQLAEPRAGRVDPVADAGGSRRVAGRNVRGDRLSATSPVRPGTPRKRRRLPVGAVDCHTFVASAGDVVRAVVSDSTTRPTVCSSTPPGKPSAPSSAARSAPSATTGLPGARSAPVQEQVTYDLWVINTSSTAGCTPLVAGSVRRTAHRDAQFTQENLTVCYTLRAPRGLGVLPAGRRRRRLVDLGRRAVAPTDASQACAQRVCTVDAAGTRLFVVSRLGRRRRSAYGFRPAPVCTGWTGSRPGHPVRSCRRRSARPPSRPRSRPSVRSTATGSPRRTATSSRSRGPGPVLRARAARDLRPDGVFQCFAYADLPSLRGAAPYRLVSYATNFPATSPYRFSIGSLTAPGSGCRPLAELPFGVAPRGAFSLDDRASMRCYRIERTSSDAYLVPRITTAPRRRARGPGARSPPRHACSPNDELGTCFARDAGRTRSSCAPTVLPPA